MYTPKLIALLMAVLAVTASAGSVSVSFGDDDSAPTKAPAKKVPRDVASDGPMLAARWAMPVAAPGKRPSRAGAGGLSRPPRAGGARGVKARPKGGRGGRGKGPRAGGRPMKKGGKGKGGRGGPRRRPGRAGPPGGRGGRGGQKGMRGPKGQMGGAPPPPPPPPPPAAEMPPVAGADAAEAPAAEEVPAY